jgi:hypothetical protein
MSKAATVRLLHAERCSVAEIAAVVGWKLCDVRWFIRTWIGGEK